MTDREQTIQSYLLGELPESEQVLFEQRYFTDQRLFEQIVKVENELNDKYVRGLLTAPTRDRFEKHYLAHAKRRERASFAEALASRLDENKDSDLAASVSTERWLDRLLVFLSGPRLAWAFSFAFLAIALIAGWLFIQRRQLRQELARTESERTLHDQREQELQQQVANERARAEAFSKQLELLRVEQGGTPAPASESQRPSTFATLVLTLGGTRAADTGPAAVLVISNRTEKVRLQLNLRENDYSSYQAVLQSAGGGEIFNWRRLTATKKNSGAHLALVLKANILHSGDYILTVRGISKTGEVEDVSKSLFRVLKRSK